MGDHHDKGNRIHENSSSGGEAPAIEAQDRPFIKPPEGIVKQLVNEKEKQEPKDSTLEGEALAKKSVKAAKVSILNRT